MALRSVVPPCCLQLPKAPHHHGNPSYLTRSGSHCANPIDGSNANAAIARTKHSPRTSVMGQPPFGAASISDKNVGVNTELPALICERRRSGGDFARDHSQCSVGLPQMPPLVRCHEAEARPDA